MLHATKSQSILQWYNALTSNVNVQSLSQFADGSLFCSIVESVYSQIQIENPIPKFLLPDTSECDETASEIGANDKTPWSKDDEGSEANASASAQQVDAMETSEDPTEDSAAKESNDELEIQKKYDLIKKFIDNFFQMESNCIISYSACMEGKDLELAKVAVLLLSAMVQNFLSSNNETLQTITLLEASVQEDIKECLSLLLERNDKEPLTKNELHKALGKPTKHKATPRRKTSYRGNTDETLSTKRRQRLSTIAYEDVQDSPLKGLLQSPNNSQHKAAIAIFKKETELSKLRNNLHIEEMKNVDLRLEKKQLNDDLLKKKEELEFMKLDFRKHKEMTEEREAHYSMERASLSEEINRLNNLIFEQKEEIASLHTEQSGFVATITELEKKLLQKNTVEESSDKFIIESMNEKIKELETENESRGNMMQEYIEKIKYLEKDVIEYKQMYEERLCRRDTPRMTPPTRETVGDIHYADAQDAVKKLGEKEREIQRVKNNYRLVKGQLKEKTDNIQAVMDKLSNLQNKHEKLLQKSLNCPTCQTSFESEESDISHDSTNPSSSSQFGKLWDNSTKSNAPTTRSKSTGSATTSAPDMMVQTVARLQAFLRSTFRLLIKWKVVEDAATLARIDSQTRKIETVDDFFKSFDVILRILRRLTPPMTEIVAGEANEPIELDSSELKKTKRRFSIMAASLRADLAKKDNDLNSAKEEIQKLQLEKESVEKEKTKMDTNLKNLQLKYDGVYKGAQKFKQDKNELALKCLNLQKEINNLQKKPESCCNCDGLHKKFVKAKEDLQGSKKEIDNLNTTIKDLHYKIKSLDHQIKNLNQEKLKLEDKILHNKAFLFGSCSARNTLINKYYQQSQAERQKKTIPDLDDLDSEDPKPIGSGITFFLCPEKKTQPESQEPCFETSTSSHFINQSFKSAYLPTEDEEDFLNHSSLSQIQGGYSEMEAVNPEQRLRELQRRNTLCPPHLQSSYPLEIQNMTPSERKYSMLPSQIASTSTSNEALKKRKVSEIDASHSNVDTRKMMRMSTMSTESAKPHTPVRLTSALKKNKTFKTPSSIRRLMRIPQRKNKQQ